MRHYETLDQAFQDLREPTIQEIDGTIDISGHRFMLTGKTLPVNYPAYATDEGLPKEIYKIYLEEIMREDPQTKLCYPDR
jgi:hypothetical protein